MTTEEGNKQKVIRAIPITFYICQTCGKQYRSEEVRNKCCMGMPRDPKYNLTTIMLYKCSMCGMVHQYQLNAETCSHWTDDEDLLEEEGKEDGATKDTL
jgi:uncharacterized Zn finger protein